MPTTVCGVDSGSGALTISAVGSCTITATAPTNANYNRASAVFELVVNEIGTLPLSLAAIAGDNAINITEKAAGFVISGETGAVAGAAVSLQKLTATSTADNPAAWSVSVPADASYIIAPSVSVTISASKIGYSAASAVTRTLGVDLTAPPARSYSAC